MQLLTVFNERHKSDCNYQVNVTAFTQSHHAWLATSNGLPANDFLNWHSEILRSVILAKFVCYADSNLLYISNLRPLYHYLASVVSPRGDFGGLAPQRKFQAPQI